VACQVSFPPFSFFKFLFSFSVFIYWFEFKLNSVLFHRF
jgi:hypothetical protein